MVQDRRCRPHRSQRLRAYRRASQGPGDQRRLQCLSQGSGSELDAVEGVLESAVFGVPHPDFGEGVTAVVVAKPGAILSEQSIVESVKARLARYKVPKRILLVDELPRNTMGKVQKNILRNTFARIYSG